jgi:hypothetical protein
MSRYLANVGRVRVACDLFVLIIHHTGKDLSRGGRGHSSLRAALDVEITTADDATGKKFKLTKARDAASGIEHGFRLDVVDVGRDSDGDPITSCVVAPAAPAPTSEAARLALDALRRLTGTADAPVPLDQWRGAVVAACRAQGKAAGTARQTWRRALKELADVGAVRLDDTARTVALG